jgi:AraC family transcriptional regulator
MTDRDDHSSVAPPPRVLAALDGSERKGPMPFGDFAQGSVTTATASTSWSHTSANLQPTRSAGAPPFTPPPTAAKSIANNGKIDAVHAVVRFSPATIVRRQSALWGRVGGEIIQVTELTSFEMRFCALSHLLIATERGERHAGESIIEGLPPSTMRNMSQKLTFVPAGRGFYEWQDPRTLSRMTCLYIDPDWLLAEPRFDRGNLEFEPRLFFADTDLWATSCKLTREIERSAGADRLYVDALGLALVCELLRLTHGLSSAPAPRGGLAPWQSKRAAEYIETHLHDRIPLRNLAAMAGLSPYHFARAFRRSFGVPPHRYHMGRRIERAKILLARQELSVTLIALELGFGDASSFAAAFRRFVGRTPNGYRRSLS